MPDVLSIAAFLTSNALCASMATFRISDLPENFQERIMPEPMSGCWLWASINNGVGYGLIQTGKKLILAHRTIFSLLVRPIPKGLKLCHKCDTPQCVNPGHMFVGTQSDNMSDASRKGRLNIYKDEDALCAKLTEDAVIYIRSSSESTASLGERFKVSPNTITQARLGNTWAHLNKSYPPKKFFSLISPDNIKIIRNDLRPITLIAKEYGVAYQTIWGIKKKRRRIDPPEKIARQALGL